MTFQIEVRQGHLTMLNFYFIFDPDYAQLIKYAILLWKCLRPVLLGLAKLEPRAQAPLVHGSSDLCKGDTCCLVGEGAKR